MTSRPRRSGGELRRLAAPVALLALVAGALACGRTTDAGSADSPKPVRIGHFPNLTHAPALLARSRGDFEKAFAPRPVRWHLFTAGPSAIEALFAGELDLLYVGPGPAVNGYVKSKGAALQVLAGAVGGGAGLVVRDGIGIATTADLSGRRIATPQLGNTQDIALRSFLLSNGLDWVERGGKVRIAPLPPADQLTLFQKGELDGAWAVEPWLSRLLVEAKGKLLFDEATLWPGGHYPTTLIVARRGFLESLPELAARALEVNRLAVEALAQGNPTARAQVETQLTSLAGKSLARGVLDAAWARLSFSTDPMPDALRKGAADAAKLGFLSTNADLSGLVASDGGQTHEVN